MSILTAALENCLEVQWKDQYECVLSPDAPPISLEASQRIIEILKILFNITYSTHRQEPSEVGDTQCLFDLSACSYHLNSELFLMSNSLYSHAPPGRCGSLPPPSGASACLPDEALFASR